MVNTEDFIKRLEILLDYYSLNASAFADKIGVQRSSLSHLLSGRNKPSLDFILKILEVYPDVDLYWILNGKGSFPKNNNEFEEIITTPTQTVFETENKVSDLFKENKNEESATNLDKKIIETSTGPKIDYNSEIDKIVVFYKNGTFKSYKPK